MAVGKRRYLPSLEGIRGYAFLLVFAVHYSGSDWSLARHSYLAYPWLLGCQLSFAALPVFFALSGYLITGILFDTRQEHGFFRVFYLRRALRVLPLYYVTLLALALLLLATGHHLLWRESLFLVYLHNFWPGTAIYELSSSLYIAHLWSLAVEEQFYLVWPLVLWFVPGRRRLLWVCYGVIAASFVARLAWPLMHMSSGSAYQNTLFRCDAIMLGAVLALYERGPAKSLAGLTRAAWWVAGLASAFLVVRALAVRQALPYDYFGIVVIMPVLSVIGASVVVLAINPGNAVNRMCERRWAVELGKMSYAMYVIHQMLAPLVLHRLIPWLASSGMGMLAGHLAGMAVAMAVTYGLSVLARVLVEEPAMRLKRHVRYGQRLAVTRAAGEVALAGHGLGTSR